MSVLIVGRMLLIRFVRSVAQLKNGNALTALVLITGMMLVGTSQLYALNVL